MIMAYRVLLTGARQNDSHTQGAARSYHKLYILLVSYFHSSLTYLDC